MSSLLRRLAAQRSSWMLCLITAMGPWMGCDAATLHQLGTIEGHLRFRQNTTAAEANSLAETAIETILVDALSALDNIVVKVDGPDLARVPIDVTAHYVVPGLTPGRYRLTTDLGLWGAELAVGAEVDVQAGVLSRAPDLVLTPAGLITGKVEIATWHEHDDDAPDQDVPPKGEGVRLQLLGTSLAAVTDADGNYVIHRIPEGIYEMITERADLSQTRRAGITVAAFTTTNVERLVLTPHGAKRPNRHPAFEVERIETVPNATPEDSDILPLPYVLPENTVRRFDQIRLRAKAHDVDGDPLHYEWSASGGRLSDALTPEPLWQPNAYSGSQATLSVTVRDGYGGIAKLTTDIRIADVFAASATCHGADIVHAYRIGAGPWRIDRVEHAGLGGNPPHGHTLTQATHLFESYSADDPSPAWTPPYVVFIKDGELHRFDTRDHTSLPLDLLPHPAQPGQRAFSTAPAHIGPYVIYRPFNSPHTIEQLHLETFAQRQLVVCPGTCRGFVTSGDELAAYGYDTAGYSVVVSTNLGASASGGPAPRIIPIPTAIGHGIALSDHKIALVMGDSGRAARNNVGLIDDAGVVRNVYEGFYDLIVWSQDSNFVYISEQEYRALRHPSFIRALDTRSSTEIRFPGKRDRNWQADRVFDARDGIALIRRITSVDWPEAADASRSEIVQVRVLEAFE